MGSERLPWFDRLDERDRRACLPARLDLPLAQRVAAHAEILADASDAEEACEGHTEQQQ